MISTKRHILLLTRSPEETFHIGQVLAEGLEEGDIIALTGELGSGKTCLTQGIANGLGVPANYTVTSPTFTLINEYPGTNKVLYHMDVYRLNGCADLDEMGYEEYLSGRGVMVIEWAEKILKAIPDDALFISMSYVEEKIRKIEMSGCPEKIGFWERTFTKRRILADGSGGSEVRRHLGRQS